LAGFQILLARCCRQEDIAVGTPIANRTRPEMEGLIGFFVNTLVLRTDLSGDPSVRELLSRVREVALGAYAHQDLPFEQLVEELHIERTLSTNPLFQVLLALQNTPQETLELPGLKLHLSSIHSGTTKLDLHISFWEEREGLSGVIEYSTDLFEADTIHRLPGHYQQILEGMVANPGQHISRLSLLTENERKQLLAWNATQRTASQHLCPHELFEAQVERTPDAVAVVYGQAQITYQELNARADQLARHLQTLGVGPERRVGICLDRSPELMIALLGVLKSGSAYVPLDPDYPAERLIFMLQDSQVSVFLTRSSLGENLPNHNFTAVYLDTQWSTIASAPARETRQYLAESNLAYVIYTSGSTGLPKGVAMHHGALANLLAWQLQAFPTERAARTLQFTSPGFDVSFQELFSTWCSGGTLVLFSEEARRDTHALLSFLNIAAIERIFLPFVALEHLALTSAARKLLPTTLREIITAGEQLQATEAIVNFLRHLQECSLYNHYGPTETHVVTAFPLRGSPENWPALPPIGSPITSTQIFLLDQHMQQVPIGVPGELYIGGDQVARGYLNRPDLTAERFVPDPYGQQSGARLYRTGDLARYRSDGTIEFLGRIDHQVKLRGYRIETGEIEAVLRQQPGVREAIVRVRESVPGDKRLIAYVVPDQGQHPLSLNELRQFLQARLPGYMLPAAFVSLEKLPLTPSGKIDHRALPLPESARNEMDVSYVPPGSPIEESLATIWATLLEVDQVGIHDNFFLSGGHSLLAIRLISRIYEAFQAELSVLDIFEAPTIARQSSIIVRKHAERADSETVSQLLAEIEQISEEETQAFLASQQLQNERES
ncbi:MAG TPA: amino acid adenylation domain-containing protein, partial [Ktedonobacteraceae bacterium]